MARLFITQRELNFISDVTKEVIKDVAGQKIYLFPISEHKTKTHDVYNEAMQKVYDNPIELEALVGMPETSVKVDKFGVDKTYKIEVYVQWRDIVEKGINVLIGDFFSYGEIFYEIVELLYTRNIFGQVEHIDGIKLSGVKAREGLFKAKVFGPSDITFTDPDAVQSVFVQQRGFEENSLGKTGDRRELVANGTLDPPLSGPQEVKAGGDSQTSSFYDED